MITNKIIENKFYLYKTLIIKVKKIHRSSNSIVVKFLLEDNEEVVPFNGGELLLSRLYTIGELSKIIGKRSDTIRKYEKNGLLPRPSLEAEQSEAYKNWRFYTESDVYDVVAFFSGRKSGRPANVKNNNIRNSIVSLREKVNKL
jgi:hypothetical protein